jgi:hypothetical protein
VTINPSPPAHDRYCASRSSFGGRALFEKLSIALNSSKFHVLPMLKLPLLFSLALCIRTRPVLLTAIMMSRGFLFSGGLSGGGGAEECTESSWIRMWVM